MAMNGLAGVAQVLENLGNSSSHAIAVDSAIIDRARLPIDRMLAFTAAIKAGQQPGSLVPHFGAA
jgi:quinolinate synthase